MGLVLSGVIFGLVSLLDVLRLIVLLIYCCKVNLPIFFGLILEVYSLAFPTNASFTEVPALTEVGVEFVPLVQKYIQVLGYEVGIFGIGDHSAVNQLMKNVVRIQPSFVSPVTAFVVHSSILQLLFGHGLDCDDVLVELA